MRVLDGSYQRLKSWLICNDAAGLDLYDQAGGFKPEAAAPGDNVDALVRAGSKTLTT